jgi:hypothetical protein
MAFATSRILTASIAAVAGAGLASTGVALAHGGGGGVPHVLHGQLVVADAQGSGTKTHDIQNGKVKAVTQHHLRVRSTDGFVMTYVLTKRTAVFGGFERYSPHLRSATPAHGGSAVTISKGDVVAVDALDRADRAPRALTVKDFGSPQTMKPLSTR